jgi:hypothetical protein
MTEKTETPKSKEVENLRKFATREETVARLALSCSEGAGAAKRFTALVRRVIKTPKTEVDRRAKEWKEARKEKIA